MPMQSMPHDFFANHTFGRNHIQHPVQTADIQPGQPVEIAQMGGAVQASSQMYAGYGVNEDLDHLVRSVGEW